MATDDKQRSLTALRDLRPGMKNVTCAFIVIDKGTTNQTKDGSIVRKCRVADKTASICFSLWNEQAGAIEPGDILKLTKGYTSIWKGGMMLYSGKYGILEKIGEFTMVFSETPDMSDPSQDFLQSQQPSHHHQPSARGGGGTMGGAGPPHPHHQLHQTGGGGGSGFQNSISPQGGPHNGRMGIGMNRNGNNHFNHGMALYSPHPPAEGAVATPPEGYNHCESNHLTRDRSMSSQHLQNFSPGHRDSPPPPPRDPSPYQPPTNKSISEPTPYEFRGKHSGGLEGRSPLNEYEEGSHHFGNNGRTIRGGFRNLVSERPHPYSRPPTGDPPRQRGGWR